MEMNANVFHAGHKHTHTHTLYYEEGEKVFAAGSGMTAMHLISELYGISHHER